VCIAYLKPGLGEKYAGLDLFDGQQVTVNEAVFSNADGEKTTIPLKYEPRTAERNEDDHPRDKQGKFAGVAGLSSELVAEMAIRQADSVEHHVGIDLDTGERVIPRNSSRATESVPRALKGPLPRLKFDVANQAAINWARAHAAALVVDILEDARFAIKTLIADGIEKGRTIRVTAKLLQRIIGLTSRQSEQVVKLYDRLESEGLDSADIDDEVNAYSTQLLKDRADTIASTETMRASNKGQQILWEQAVEEGHLTGLELREWITTPDDRLCPVCEAMDGQTVGLVEPFTDEDGNEYEVPPLHPKCRCTIGISAAKVRAAEWREEDHPRAEDGKLTGVYGVGHIEGREVPSTLHPYPAGKNPHFDAAVEFVKRNYKGPYPLPPIYYVRKRDIGYGSGIYLPEHKVIAVPHSLGEISPSYFDHAVRDLIDTLGHELSHYEDHMDALSKGVKVTGRGWTSEGKAGGAGSALAERYWAQRPRRDLAEWDESKHPREEDGKFTEVAGGGPGDASTAAYEAELRRQSDAGVAACEALLDRVVATADFEGVTTGPKDWESVDSNTKDEILQTWYEQEEEELRNNYDTSAAEDDVKMGIRSEIMDEDDFINSIDAPFIAKMQEDYGINIDPESLTVARNNYPDLYQDELLLVGGGVLTTEQYIAAEQVYNRMARIAVDEEVDDRYENDEKYKEQVWSQVDEAVSEQASENWHYLSDSGKFAWAEENGLLDERIQVEPGLPEHWKSGAGEVEDKTSQDDEDYARTSVIAREMAVLRTADIMRERGLGGGDDPGQRYREQYVRSAAEEVWSEWKGSSVSDSSLALQLATARELGGVHRLTSKEVETAEKAAALLWRSELHPRDAEGRFIDVTTGEPMSREKQFIGLGEISQEQRAVVGMRVLQSYVRGQWDTTQFVLAKEGKDALPLYRGLVLPKSVVDAATHTPVGNPALPNPDDAIQLPDLAVLRSGAQSTTSVRDVANSWQGTNVRLRDDTVRVVLRIQAPRTAVLSIPVFGQNVTEEREVVLAGTKGDWRWDAWLGRAPNFDRVPLRGAAAAPTPVSAWVRRGGTLVIDLMAVDRESGVNWLRGKHNATMERMKRRRSGGLQERTAEFNPDLHPRAEDGKFADGGGDNGAPSWVSKVRTHKGQVKGVWYRGIPSADHTTPLAGTYFTRSKAVATAYAEMENGVVVKAPKEVVAALKNVAVLDLNTDDGMAVLDEIRTSAGLPLWASNGGDINIAMEEAIPVLASAGFDGVLIKNMPSPDSDTESNTELVVMGRVAGVPVSGSKLSSGDNDPTYSRDFGEFLGTIPPLPEGQYDPYVGPSAEQIAEYERVDKVRGELIDKWVADRKEQRKRDAAEWREEDHPRAPDGKFDDKDATDKGDGKKVKIGRMKVKPDTNLRKAWGATFGKMSTDEVAERMLVDVPGAKKDWTVEVMADKEGKVLIRARNDVATVTREFDGDTVHHELMDIKFNAQGSGIARDLVERQFEFYREAGIKHVEMTANLNVGGYAWARAGFEAASPGFVADSVLDRVAHLVSAEVLTAAQRDGIKALVDAHRNDPGIVWRLADLRDTVTNTISRVIPEGDMPLGKALLLELKWAAKADVKNAMNPATPQGARFAAYFNRKKS
jgi:hypothetical protein